MQIIVTLFGTVPGQNDQIKFRKQSGDGKTADQWEGLARHIRQESPVTGLRMTMRTVQGDGVIELRAPQDQLRPAVVEDVRRFVEGALEKF